MLSRRTSNMIFYGVMLAITLAVVIARLIIVGSVNKRIDETTLSNRRLQAQIENLEIAVQENKHISSEHLYELYDMIPQIYNQDELTYYTEAQLELIGITDQFEVNRVVNIDEEIVFGENSAFYDISNDFKIVEVYVYFEINDLTLVDEFVDKLYSSEQIFVVSEIEFSSFNTGGEVGVNVTFLSFYEKE